jgi:hypothetical protein
VKGKSENRGVDQGRSRIIKNNSKIEAVANTATTAVQHSRMSESVEKQGSRRAFRRNVGWLADPARRRHAAFGRHLLIWIKS